MPMTKGSALPPPWRRPFLKHLARYGNVHIACQLAQVDRSYVYRQRRDDPGFAGKWDAAKIEAGRQLRLRHDALPPRGRKTLQGGTLALSGMRGGRVRIERARRGRWTREDEIRFLNRYAATGNVEEASRAAGHRNSSAYQRRKYCARFAREWALAKALAQEGLPLRIVAAAKLWMDGAQGLHPIDPDDVPVMNLRDALDALAALYHLHPKWRDNNGKGWGDKDVWED